MKTGTKPGTRWLSVELLLISYGSFNKVTDIVMVDAGDRLF